MIVGRLRIGLVVFGTALLAAACGLDVVGATAQTTGASEAEEAGASKGPPSSSDTPVDLGDDDAGASKKDAAPQEETPIDAGPKVDSGPCGATTLADNFAQGLGEWSHYGGVQKRTSGNNAYARLIEEGDDGRAAGLFWLPTAKAKSFRAEFAYFVATPSDPSYMGDGMTFTWLTSVGATPLGTDAVSGQAFGLTPTMAGHAFALDAWQNSSIGDLGEPSFSILGIDPTRGAPGSYDWHIAKKGPYENDDVYDAWRYISVAVANGKASATFRFSATGSPTPLFTDVAVDTSKNIVAIGFTAATGGADAMGFFVDTVSFELLDATCQ